MPSVNLDEAQRWNMLRGWYAHMKSLQSFIVLPEIQTCLKRSSFPFNDDTVTGLHDWTFKAIGNATMGEEPKLLFNTGTGLIDIRSFAFPLGLRHSRRNVNPKNRVCLPLLDRTCWPEKAHWQVDSCTICCDPSKGPFGDPSCWQNGRSYERCCQQDFKGVMCDEIRKSTPGCLDCPQHLSFFCEEEHRFRVVRAWSLMNETFWKHKEELNTTRDLERDLQYIETRIELFESLFNESLPRLVANQSAFLSALQLDPAKRILEFQINRQNDTLRHYLTTVRAPIASNYTLVKRERDNAFNSHKSANDSYVRYISDEARERKRKWELINKTADYRTEGIVGQLRLQNISLTLTELFVVGNLTEESIRVHNETVRLKETNLNSTRQLLEDQVLKKSALYTALGIHGVEIDLNRTQKELAVLEESRRQASLVLSNFTASELRWANWNASCVSLPRIVKAQEDCVASLALARTGRNVREDEHRSLSEKVVALNQTVTAAVNGNPQLGTLDELRGRFQFLTEVQASLSLNATAKRAVLRSLEESQSAMLFRLGLMDLQMKNLTTDLAIAQLDSAVTRQFQLSLESAVEESSVQIRSLTADLAPLRMEFVDAQTDVRRRMESRASRLAGVRSEIEEAKLEVRNLRLEIANKTNLAETLQRHATLLQLHMGLLDSQYGQVWASLGLPVGERVVRHFGSWLNLLVGSDSLDRLAGIAAAHDKLGDEVEVAHRDLSTAKAEILDFFQKLSLVRDRQEQAQNMLLSDVVLEYKVNGLRERQQRLNAAESELRVMIWLKQIQEETVFDLDGLIEFSAARIHQLQSQLFQVSSNERRLEDELSKVIEDSTLANRQLSEIEQAQNSTNLESASLSAQLSLIINQAPHLPALQANLTLLISQMAALSKSLTDAAAKESRLAGELSSLEERKGKAQSDCDQYSESQHEEIKEHVRKAATELSAISVDVDVAKNRISNLSAHSAQIQSSSSEWNQVGLELSRLKQVIEAELLPDLLRSRRARDEAFAHLKRNTDSVAKLLNEEKALQVRLAFVSADCERLNLELSLKDELVVNITKRQTEFLEKRELLFPAVALTEANFTVWNITMNNITSVIEAEKEKLKGFTDQDLIGTIRQHYHASRAAHANNSEWLNKTFLNLTEYQTKLAESINKTVELTTEFRRFEADYFRYEAIFEEKSKAGEIVIKNFKFEY